MATNQMYEGMYAMYKQVHPPTAVEHCVFCHFFSREERSLVVAKTSELCVYRLNTQIKVSYIHTDSSWFQIKNSCITIVPENVHGIWSSLSRDILQFWEKCCYLKGHFLQSIWEIYGIFSFFLQSVCCRTMIDKNE